MRERFTIHPVEEDSLLVPWACVTSMQKNCLHSGDATGVDFGGDDGGRFSLADALRSGGLNAGGSVEAKVL